MLNTSFDSRILLVFLWRNRKTLIGVSLFAGLLASLISSPWIIRPKYKSYAVVYPHNLVAYSNESQTEQMLQVLESNFISDTLVKHFKLFNHFGIDPKSEDALSTLQNTISSNITFTKTSFEAVKIEVLAYNPDTAALMVSFILDVYDLKMRAMQREKIEEQAMTTFSLVESTRKVVDSLENRLHFIRSQKGLIESSGQVRELTRGYVINQGKATSANRGVDSLLANFKNYGEEFNSLNQQVSDYRAFYTQQLTKYESQIKDANKKLSYTNRIVEPFPSDVKAYPVRWLVVLVSVVMAFVLSFAVLLAMHKGRDLWSMLNEEDVNADADLQKAK